MSEADPLGIHVPLLEQIQAAVDDVGFLQPLRHNAPVLNARTPNEVAARFLLLAAEGDLTIEKVKWTEHEVASDLRGFTVLVLGTVVHVDTNETPAEFNGWHVAEELGGSNPFLLLGRERAYRHDRNLAAGDELGLRFLQRE